MTDLAKLQAFAAENAFGLTAPLTHAQVERLAQNWLPETRFHFDERFHPVGLDDMFAMIDQHSGNLEPAAQEAFRVTQFERQGGLAVAGRFDPPVVRLPDGVGQTVTGLVPTFRIVASGSGAREALRRPEVGSDASITHGASFTRGNAFFGAVETLNGGNTSAPSEPFLPRAREKPEDPASPRRIQLTASFLNLIDLLKYELLITGDDSYPGDGLRRGFAVAAELLRPVGNQAPLPGEAIRSFLLAAIKAFEAGQSLPDPPPGWRLDRVAWDTVTRFAFLEYDFFYAYNDFDRYQTALFENEHEGDSEGCCLVFDRGAIALAAGSDDENALFRVIPHSVITSVHEEHHKSDLIQTISPPPPGTDPTLAARDLIPFKVFIAGGSHATYLTPGTHDLVDFQDTWATVEEEAPILLVLAPAVLAVAIVLAIIEHFVDTEDFTSDEGVHSGPPDKIAGDPLGISARLLTMPMSADNHVYQSANEDLLLLRAFPGKWGGHNGLVDKSPAFTPKSGRYFRRLLRFIRN